MSKRRRREWMTEKQRRKMLAKWEQRKRDSLSVPEIWPPPDTIAKDWQHAGLRCVVARGPFALCGYVLVPRRHPLASQHYEDFDSQVDVHGGLTFCRRDLDGGMWFGFDCAHGWDWISLPPPPMEMPPELQAHYEEVAHLLEIPGQIWTVDDVAAEVESLAEQLASIKIPQE